VGPTAGLDRCGKSRPPTGIRSPDHPARSSVAIPTELPGPREISYIKICLPVKYPLFMSDFSETCIFVTCFRKTLKYEI